MSTKFFGKVIQDKSDKTIKVLVERKFIHSFYGKVVKRYKSYQVHDENNKFKIGDSVFFENCAPKSKTKSWIVINKEKKAKAIDNKSKRNLNESSAGLTKSASVEASVKILTEDLKEKNEL